MLEAYTSYARICEAFGSQPASVASRGVGVARGSMAYILYVQFRAVVW